MSRKAENSYNSFFKTCSVLKKKKRRTLPSCKFAKIYIYTALLTPNDNEMITKFLVISIELSIFLALVAETLQEASCKSNATDKRATIFVSSGFRFAELPLRAELVQSLPFSKMALAQNK